MGGPVVMRVSPHVSSGRNVARQLCCLRVLCECEEKFLAAAVTVQHASWSRQRAAYLGSGWRWESTGHDEVRGNKWRVK